MNKATFIAILASTTSLVSGTTDTFSRDASAIAQVISRHKEEVGNIYNTYLAAGLEFQGTVTVRFTIARSGTVTASEVAGSDTGYPLFDGAVAEAVLTWDFGPSTGDPVTVKYPFAFSLPKAKSPPETDGG